MEVKMAYTIRKKRHLVKQALLGITTIAEICRNRRVPRRTLYRWIERYKKFSWKGLENRKIGRKPDAINPKFEIIVYKLWHLWKYGSPKMWSKLKEMGFFVSQRQIQKIYQKYEFKMNRRKRPSQIKFVKYEWPKPNMLWHTDWTTCPFTNKQLIAFIDDHSRFIVHAEFFEKATTKNTILAFENAIRRYGKPENILTDNGTQFTPARGVLGPFSNWCKKNGIKHILGRVHHPQTNGKIERWFGTYKMEYDERFNYLEEFVMFYNEVRIHQGISYATPLQRYKSAINSV
jgi:putative transposase